MIINVNIIIIILIIREDKFSLCECACLEKKIFKGLHQIFYVQIVFGYYFANNVCAPPFEQTLITHTQGLFVCNI